MPHFSDALPTPGVIWGAYPERQAEATNPADALVKRTPWLGRRRLQTYQQFLTRLQQRRQAWHAGREQPERQIFALRARLAAEGLNDATLCDSFVVLEALASRILGMSPRANQLLAARAMLDRRLVELDTGEGKTLAVAFAAASAALAGIPVHVMTANDYLAARDRGQLAPFYQALGLTAGVVIQASDAAERRHAYACHIAYCTAKELGFDYLRDRLANAGGRRLPDRAVSAAPLLRGLCMAIIDEADSILLDDARVPLILARNIHRGRELEDLGQALALAAQLTPREHFHLDHGHHQAHLSPAGKQRLEQLAGELPALWRNRRHRENRVALALSALHLFQRDRDYLLRDGQIQIIDPGTGRVAAGRAWSQGLHQCIELKEGCAQTQGQIPGVQITFQQLFRRYLWCCGTSGSLWEARGELAEIYDLQVVRIAPHRPSRRRDLGSRLYPDQTSQWQDVLTKTRDLHINGQPVLIGVDSVADCDSLASLLRAAGLPVQVLNAHQDRQEARLIALAGQRGQITVSTNIAGRGADIPLGAGVEALGGLHVISCQHNADRRIDRQLAGRCARQGQVGSLECLLSLDSGLSQRQLPAALRHLLANRLEHPLAQALGRLLLRRAQRREQRQARAARRQLLQQQQQLAHLLAFAGPVD